MQLVRASNPDRYSYVEHGSKNNTGVFGDVRENKVVTVYQSKNSSYKDHVGILDLYLSKVPQEACGLNERFYLHPMMRSYEVNLWFCKTPLGVHKIQSMVKDMCKDASVDGNFTNHSLRATGATVLFNGGVPEHLIQQRTGHKSLGALRLYERPSADQSVVFSNLLNLNSEGLYSEEIVAVKRSKDQPASLSDVQGLSSESVM